MMNNSHPPGWVPVPKGWRWDGRVYDNPSGVVWFDRSTQNWMATTVGSGGEYTVIVEDPVAGFIEVEEGT